MTGRCARRHREYTFAMTSHRARLAALCTLLLAAVACTGTAPRPDLPAASTAAATVAVAEAFVSEAHENEELDSLATWPTEDGGLWVIATAKATHRL